MTMFPSACIWTCRTPVIKTLVQLKTSAFHSIDIEPRTLDAPGALELHKSLGMRVSCIALDHNAPFGDSLNGQGHGVLGKAVEYLKQGLEQGQRLGAQAAYIRPCLNRKHLNDFRSIVTDLADFASNKGIRLCVEHFPGRALATAKDTLEFLNRINHSNVFLLLDVGHTLLSREKAWEVVATAGNRLGYVQFDDNDGKKDLHWPLLDGLLTLEDLRRTLAALQQIGYGGSLGLELNEIRPTVLAALARNRNLLLRLQATDEPKSLKEPERRRKQ